MTWDKENDEREWRERTIGDRGGEKRKKKGIDKIGSKWVGRRE